MAEVLIKDITPVTEVTDSIKMPASTGALKAEAVTVGQIKEYIKKVIPEGKPGPIGPIGPMGPAGPKGEDSKVITEDHGTGDAVFALTPNTYHIWGEMAKLEVSESAGEQGQMNVYMFEFTSGASATQLTYPGTWKWMGGTAPVISPNKRYQIGVLNNLAKIDEYEK